MCCFYMPAQWMMARLQWAAGEKMCHLPSGQQRTGGVLWSGDIASTWGTLRKQVRAPPNAREGKREAG